MSAAPPPECGPAGGRKGSADDEREACAHEREPEPAQLQRDERLDAPDSFGADLEDENRRAREQRDRQQEMDHDDRPAQI